MNMKKWLLKGLMPVLFLYGCFEDDSNLDIRTLNPITIENLGESTRYSLFTGDTLKTNLWCIVREFRMQTCLLSGNCSARGLFQRCSTQQCICVLRLLLLLQQGIYPPFYGNGQHDRNFPD